jgi:hypothetical protein
MLRFMGFYTTSTYTDLRPRGTHRFICSNLPMSLHVLQGKGSPQIPRDCAAQWLLRKFGGHGYYLLRCVAPLVSPAAVVGSLDVLDGFSAPSHYIDSGDFAFLNSSYSYESAG